LLEADIFLRKVRGYDHVAVAAIGTGKQLFKRKRIRKNTMNTCRPTYLSRDRNAGHNHNIQINNISFERVEQSEYLGTTLTNRNSIHEEIKSRVKSGNACYQSVQNLSSRLLSKNIKD
jgi:hypothetical protein